MTASRSDIREWISKGRVESDVTHMIIMCDLYDSDGCCYPVYVKFGNVRAMYAHLIDSEDILKEVYWIEDYANIEEQLSENRTRTFGPY